jgi:hypothetical protein
MNALVMYDHQTDILWSQFLSRGVKGPLADTKLEIVPSIQTTWQQWLRLHPDTLVLDKRGNYQWDSYEGYYVDGSAGILGESNKDNRLPRKELVLGVDREGRAKAYPFPVIANQRVINDFFAGDDVVVTFDQISETGAIFKRTIEGRSLTFHPLPNTDQGIMLMQDQETGSTWQAFTGRAIDGPMAGKALARLPSHYSFWFAWSDFHPDTELYGAG